MTIVLFDSEHIEVDDANRDSWCTPQPIVDALLQMWPDGPDLDPCSNSRAIVPAKTRWTIADDGLSQRWFGRAYCNPPYSDPRAWAEKCSRREAAEVVACIICDPSVSWWRLVWTCNAICFPGRRIDFLPPPNVTVSSFNRPVALPYWGPYSGAFEHAFYPLGKVIRL